MKLNFSGGKILAILAAIVAAAAVAASIWLNPPSENRARSLDQERLKGLNSAEFAIKSYADLHHALPANLQLLESENGLLTPSIWHDPVTNQPYEYVIINENSYRLCANFSRNSDKAENGYSYQFKNHGAGHVCFQYGVRLHE